MARFRDLMPEQQGWVHDLARAELHPDAEKLFALNRGGDPQQMVEESTIGFLTELRNLFQAYAQVFNGYAESGQRFQEIKIYSVAQTAADFMVFRSQIKLVISNQAHGVVALAFSQHVPGSLGQAAQTIVPPQELLAQLGPFRDVYWTFQGERVTAEQVAKFYFGEFVRATRDSRRSRTGNQQLLNQIKALLQEKGLDI